MWTANNRFYIATPAGGIIQHDGGAILTEKFDNNIFDEGTNKLLQTDFTGHIIIDENAIGTDSFTLRLDYVVFGHAMGNTDCGIFTIVGFDSSESIWKSDRITSKNGGFATGLGISVGGSNGFPYGSTTVAPFFREMVISYNSIDKLYKYYQDGVLLDTSVTLQLSGEWDTRKLYLGFSGRNSIGAGNGVSQLDTATGEFTANGVRNDGRNADLQTRMDNIQVYKRALTDTEVTTLFNGGTTLSANEIENESLFAYPNPVVDYLELSSNDVDSVEIYSILGSNVSNQKVTNKVNMTSLSSGVYVVRCKDAKGGIIRTIRIVKK